MSEQSLGHAKSPFNILLAEVRENGDLLEDLAEEIQKFWVNMRVPGEAPEDIVGALNVLRLRYIAQHPGCPDADK